MTVEKIVTVIVVKDELMRGDEAVKEEPAAKIFAEVAAETEIADDEGVVAVVMKGQEMLIGIVDAATETVEEIENRAVER